MAQMQLYKLAKSTQKLQNFQPVIFHAIHVKSFRSKRYTRDFYSGDVSLLVGLFFLYVSFSTIVRC